MSVNIAPPRSSSTHMSLSMLLSYEVGDIIKPYHNVYMNTYIYDVNYNENGRQPSLEIFQMKNE